MSACPSAKKTKMRESETGDKYKKGDRIFAKLKGYPIWPAQVKGRSVRRNEQYDIIFYGTHDNAVMKPEMMWSFNPQTVAKYSKSSSPKSFKNAMKEIEANLDLVQHSVEHTTVLESAAALSPVTVLEPAPVASAMSPEPSSASTSLYPTIPFTDEAPPVCPSGSAVNSTSYIEDTNFGVDFEDELSERDDASSAFSNVHFPPVNGLEQNPWNSNDLGFGRLVGSQNQNQSQGQISSPFPAPFQASSLYVEDYGQSRSMYFDWGNYGGPAPAQSHPFPHYPFSPPPYYNYNHYNDKVPPYGPPRFGYPYHPQYGNQQPPYWTPRHPLPPYARPSLRPQHAPQAPPSPLTAQASTATTGASNATVQSRMKIDSDAKMNTSLPSATVTTTTTSSSSKPVGPQILLTKANPALNSTPLVTISTEAACAQQTTEKEIDLGFGIPSSVSSSSQRRGIKRLFDDVKGKTDGIPTKYYRCIVQNCDQEYFTKEYFQILEHICKTHLKIGSQNRHIYVYANTGASNRSQTFMCNFQGCEVRKKGQSNLGKHTNEHLRKSVDCTVGRCSKSFFYTNQMQQHVRTDHSVTPHGRIINKNTK